MTVKKIKQEVIDELMKEYRGPEDFQALFMALKKAVMERALNAELSVHLGYEKGEEKPGDQFFEDNNIRVALDMKSFLYLAGTELDFSDGLNGKGFNFQNPNATRTCGCGESFSV